MPVIIFPHCWVLQLSTFPNISIKKRHYTSCAQLEWESSLKGTDKLNWGAFGENDVENNNKKYVCIISVNKKQSWKIFERTSQSTSTSSSPIPMLKLFLESRKVQINLWSLSFWKFALMINLMAKTFFFCPCSSGLLFFFPHIYLTILFNASMTCVHFSTEIYRLK